MRAFLRGMLLGGGTMTNPEQGYHLEIAFRDEESRVMLAKCMQRLGLPIRISARREHSYLYLKQSDQIVTLAHRPGRACKRHAYRGPACAPAGAGHRQPGDELWTAQIFKSR